VALSLVLLVVLSWMLMVILFQLLLLHPYPNPPR
jgi:hypothetical protein